MPVALRREEAVDVVAVRVGVTGKRTLGQGLQSLAGAIGIALLFPVAILIMVFPSRSLCDLLWMPSHG